MIENEIYSFIIITFETLKRIWILQFKFKFFFQLTVKLNISITYFHFFITYLDLN